MKYEFVITMCLQEENLINKLKIRKLRSPFAALTHYFIFNFTEIQFECQIYQTSNQSSLSRNISYNYLVPEIGKFRNLCGQQSDL